MNVAEVDVILIPAQAGLCQPSCHALERLVK